MTPKIVSYLYTGTNTDGACCLGVLAAINPDGTAELWSHEPNLGMVLQVVKAETLEIACPIHALPRPETKKEYDGRLLDAMNAFFDKVRQGPSCADDLREIARLANYMADLWEFVDYGDEALTAGGRQTNGLHLGSCADVPSVQRVANAERQDDTLTEAAEADQ